MGAGGGIDPLEYRLKLLANRPDPGWAKVLREVADKSGWGKSLPKGMGQGIAIALDQLGPKREAVRSVFITVDPERDTPEVLKEYVTSFDAPILALSGSPEEIARAAKAYRVYYAKHPEPGADYSMDHSSVIYVMDPEGRFTASFTHQSTPEEIAERLKKLLALRGSADRQRLRPLPELREGSWKGSKNARCQRQYRIIINRLRQLPANRSGRL